jgi:hypothetical protein
LKSTERLDRLLAATGAADLGHHLVCMPVDGTEFLLEAALFMSLRQALGDLVPDLLDLGNYTVSCLGHSTHPSPQ